MNNIKKRFTVTVSGILTVFLLPLEMALAAPADEMGCIARQQGSMKFVKSDQLDRQTIMESCQGPAASRYQGD